MKKEHLAIALVPAFLSGLIGGALSPYLLGGAIARAQNDQPDKGILTAKEIRLVDRSGQVRMRVALPYGHHASPASGVPIHPLS